MITIHADIRASGQCMKGAREWCSHNNISWSDFLKNGIDASILESFDDALLNAVVAKTKERYAKTEATS